jgi:hypothetical protein
MSDEKVWDNKTVSTVIRFHNRERLPLLEEAVASLAAQHWQDFELVVTLQNPEAGLPAEVERIIRRQSWPAEPRFRIVPVEVPAGFDGRSELMNRGLAAAAGRFVAFLDDDDVVYEHGYAMLVKALLAGDRVIAVGGYRKAYMAREGGVWRVRSREASVVPEPSRLTLFQYNYIPPLSYVIDRSRLGGFELYFDDDLPPLEDYDFLLRLCALFEPDFTCFDTPVCEYRIHELNTIGASMDRPEEQSPALRRAHGLIAERKKTLRCVYTAEQLSALSSELGRLRGERGRFMFRFAERAHAAVDRHPALRARLRVARDTLRGALKKG